MGSQRPFGAFCPPCWISMCQGCPAGRQAPQPCVGGGRTRSPQIPGASSGSPWPRMENATRGPHNPSCCNPRSWRHQRLSEKCVVQGLNSYLCVCRRSGGSCGGVEAHKNNQKRFICFFGCFYGPMQWAVGGGPGRSTKKLLSTVSFGLQNVRPPTAHCMGSSS